MVIRGLQKLSMVDYPGTLAATVFTGGCNWRCPFCHNALLVLNPEDAENISEEEFFAFLKERKGKLTGVCVSGGEPLLNDDIDLFLEKIKAMGYSVKLDTNGSFPERLERVLNKGLVDYVAMDIKNSRAGYPRTVGIKDYKTDKVEKSVNLLMSGKIPYEFRITLVNELHTEEDIEEIGRWLDKASIIYLQHFVDSGNIIGKSLSAASKKDTLKYAEILKKHIAKVEIRGID